MQHILIIGATSAIAESTARLFAARGDRLFLLARDVRQMGIIATDLGIRGAATVDTAHLDVNDIDSHVGMLDKAWESLGQVDIVLIAHGTLPDQIACEASTAATMTEFQTNATSTIALLTGIAARMGTARAGTIAVISSVAGDRGRASNYVYGAAKAAVSTFLSGLRQRLAPVGVHVLTVKPGFVDTPMTRDFNKSMLWAKPEQVANGIVRAIDKHKDVVYLPWFWSPIMLIIRHIPEWVFRRVKL